MKAHQNNTKDFLELSFKEQASSLTAQELNLEKQYKAHIKTAINENRNVEDVKNKLLNSIKKLEDFVNSEL